jgi:hypothetical protein
VIELLYDIPIVIPLMIERWVIALGGNQPDKVPAKSGSTS